MVNALSLPNFHEDAPSALETGLATSIGNRNPLGAAMMLIAEQNRRGQAQDAYHSYFDNVSNLQRQNMSAGLGETALKEFTGLIQHDPGGALGAARLIPGIGQFLPPAQATGDLETNIANKQNATNVHNIGVGAGAANTGGVQLPLSMLPAGTTIGPPGVVQAQAVANEGRLGAAALAAGAKPTGETTTTGGTITKPVVTKTFEYGNAPSAAPHGLGSVIPPASAGNGVGKGNPLLGGLTSPAPDAPLQTAQPDVSTPPVFSQDKINQALMQLKKINPKAYDDAVKGGGKVGMRPDGKPGIVGASGQVY